jgi:predicted nucleic acid-binding Zn ribbon protein
MSYPRDFKPLGELLPQWIEQRKQPFRGNDLLPQNFSATWMQIVGPILARYSRPVKLMGPTLSVEVSSKAWCQALEEQRQFLLHQLKVRLPKLSIRDILFFTPGA